MDLSVPFQIRPIDKNDDNNLSPVSKRNFHPMGATTTPEQCTSVCESNVSPESDRYDLVGLADGQVVGWGFLWGVQSEKVSLGLCIADAWQQRGLGTAMMSALVQQARRLRLPALHLTCVEDNAIAQQLYESFGFERNDRHAGEDGLCYVGMIAQLAR